jgi:hypothetical protein
MNPLGLLQRGQNAQKIRDGRAALGPEHPHQTLRGNVGPLLKILKSNGRVDVVAKHSLPRSQVSVQDALDGLAQKSLRGCPRNCVNVLREKLGERNEEAEGREAD